MSTLLGRFCKDTPPSSLSTKGNLMYVRYYTNLPEPRNGFKALITTGGKLNDYIMLKFR